MDPKGYLSLVLHAHLPYVRHPEYEDFLEEDWFYEAITETYIPLLQMMEGLQRDGVDFRLTMSLTPPLIGMLTDPLLTRRYQRHIERLIELAEKEVGRNRDRHPFEDTARMYLDKFRQARALFVDQYHSNLVTGFKRFQDAGFLEIITCGATHGFLPLMVHREAMRAQIFVAADFHKRHLGRGPRGIWLAECGYMPGCEEYLREAGIRFFFVDSHGLLLGHPRPRWGVFAPVLTPARVAAFGRDHESSKQVWSSEEGYPGDWEYRDFYRDIGFDLPMDYVGPYVHESGLRKNTGIKYHRITGKTDQKEPYVYGRAMEKAASHAGNFLFNREKQVEHLAGIMEGRAPLIVSPYDAELFGHWWYEGPLFLNFLFRKLHFDQATVKPLTPWEYLQRFPEAQISTPSMSSWGYKGYSEVWLEGSNDWIYRHLHKAAERMIGLANRHGQASGGMTRLLNQAARELLLAQSSDWAFIMKTGTMVDYAVKRTKEHVTRFNKLYDLAQSGSTGDGYVGELESRDNLFPEIDYHVYRSDYQFALT
jgi:1,4-alpha-glucan branching enzyme